MKKRVISMLLSVLMLFSLVPVSVFADGTETTGGVTLTKKLVSQVPDEYGYYTLELTVSGEGITQTIGGTAGDIILVIDNSGSMTEHVGGDLCDKTGADIKAEVPDVDENRWLGYTEIVYTCPNPDCAHRYTEYMWTEREEVFFSDLPGDDEKCNHRTTGQTRLAIAQEAAKAFADYVLKTAEGSKIAVIGFAGSNGGVNDNTAIKTSSGLTDNYNSIASTIDAMRANGGTNYTAALSAAENMLKATDRDQTRPGYVIFLTDGAPGKSGGSIGVRNWDGFNQAESIKENYTLFTIGILLDPKDDADAIDHLESLASTPSKDHFVNLADADEITEELEAVLDSWAEQIIQYLAGTDAVLTDIVSNNFTVGEVSEGAILNKEDGHTVTWEIGDITDEPKSIQIKIKPNDGLSDDIKTNVNNSDPEAPSCELTYTDPDGEIQKETAESPTLELVKIDVTKVWKVEEGTDLPEEITVGLEADGELGRTITLSAENEWKGAFTSLPKYSDDKKTKVVYTIDEYSVKGYSTDITGDAETGFTITNTPATEAITVTKVWEDADDQDGKRPESVTFHLYKNGTDTHEVVLLTAPEEDPDSDRWTAQVSVETEAEYTLKEVNVPEGYIDAYDQDAYTVTNTYVPATIDEIIVEKVWDDDDNKDNSRPDEITIHLLANNKPFGEPMTMTASTQWQPIKFENLPMFAGGELIDYSIMEEEIYDDAGTLKYSYVVEESESDGNPFFTITNTYPANPVEVSVTKVWNDEDNQDGIRPDAVTIQLLGDGKEYQKERLTADENGNWTHTFTNLPMYNAGVGIVYTVAEVEVEGYTTEITGDAENGFTVTNTHEPANYDDDEEDGYGPIIVTKTWDDSNNKEGFRPESITVTLYADGAPTDNTVTLSEANDWTAAFGEVPVFAKGAKIAYSVQEGTLPEGYTVATSSSVEETADNVKSLKFTITNSRTVDVTHSVTVTKVWDDANDQDSKRPESIEVTLVANGKPTESTAILRGEGNEWTYTFKGLQKYANGEEIVYTVDEETVPKGYTKSINGTTITNTHKPATYDEDDTDGYGPITITKYWDDADNQDGKRPESITVTLSADGVEPKSYTISGSANANTWTYTIPDAYPVFAGGEEIEYTLTEAEVEGYSAKVAPSAIETFKGAFTITNTHEPETVDITVVKEWNHESDAGNTNSNIPTESTFHLLKNNEHDETRKVTLRAGDDGKWSNEELTYTWENLPKYENGELVDYAVLEGDVKDYTAAHVQKGNTFTVTNKFDPEAATQITVGKVWNDDHNRDGLRPDTVVVGVYSYNTSAGETEDDAKPVVKEGEHYQITLTPKTTQESPTAWGGIFTGLETVEGIEYIVKEVTVPEGYTSVVTKTEGTHDFTITNTLITYDPDTPDPDPDPDPTDPIFDRLTVTKVWADKADQDGKRPDSITVKLMNGQKVVETLIMNGTGDTWTDWFKEKHPVYDEKGDVIPYTVAEETVDGYTTEYAPEYIKEDETLVKVDGFTITNKHTPADYDDDEDGDDFGALTVTKIWDDKDNQDGFRPESVIISLMKPGVEDALEVLTVTGSMDENEWSGKFTGSYPVYEGGNVINYTIVENGVTEYITKEPIITPNDDNVTIAGFIITNTHKPATYDEDDTDGFGPINVTKTWRDDYNRDGKRPEKVTITLYADGEPTDFKIDLSGESTAEIWSGKFVDVPVYADGAKIEYTIEESEVADYLKPKYSGDVEGGFNVTNGRYPEKIDEIIVTKVWNDDDNRDGLRPESVTIHLLDSNNKEVKSAVANADNDWTVSFADLNKYENEGKEINWKVREDSVANYTLESMEGSVENGFKITNSYTPGRTSLTVVKQWDDADNQDNKRPDSIEVQLMQVKNGKEVEIDGATVILNDANDWTAIFTHLYMNENGEPIVYSVKEVEVPDGYEVSYLTPYSGAQSIIVNIHIPADYDDPKDDPTDTDGYEPITVTKLWSDDEAYHAYQPESIEVELLKKTETDYILVDSAVLNKGNGWKAEFGSQPVFEKGEKIEYTVEEVAVDGYTSKVTSVAGEKSLSFKLENEFTGEVADLTITKDITGNASSRSDVFTFKVVFEDAKAELDIPETGLYYSGTLDGRQTISGWIGSGDTFQLMGNGSITIHGVPLGTLYTVTETKTLGYTVRAYNASGTLEEDTLAEFVNKKTKPIIPIIPIIPKPEPDPDPIIPEEPDEPIETPEDLNIEDHFAYIIGYPDGTVRPEREITRAEVATIFFRMLTDEARERYWSTENDFTDVAQGDWYNNAISTLTKVGVINGYPDGTFRPNASITRAEIVKIAVSFFDFVEANDHLFSDVDGHWAEAYIAAASEKGLINGYPDGTFKPDRNVTRAEAVTIINNVLGRKPCKDRLLDEMIFWPDNADEDMWYYEAIQEATNSHEYVWEDLREKLCEQWTRLLPVRDWATLERAWAANMAPNPGEVMNNP